MQPYLNAFLGGSLIGISATLLLFFNGRIAGISGILNNFFQFTKTETFWRASFLGGLLCGSLLIRLINPESLENTLSHPPLLTALGGLLVGYGTLLGSGCTSGHGVCGISRLSKRSFFATLNFMTFAILTVYTVKTFLLKGTL